MALLWGEKGIHHLLEHRARVHSGGKACLAGGGGHFSRRVNLRGNAKSTGPTLFVSKRGKKGDVKKNDRGGFRGTGARRGGHTLSGSLGNSAPLGDSLGELGGLGASAEWAPSGRRVGAEWKRPPTRRARRARHTRRPLGGARQGQTHSVPHSAEFRKKTYTACSVTPSGKNRRATSTSDWALSVLSMASRQRVGGTKLNGGSHENTTEVVSFGANGGLKAVTGGC